MDRRPPAELEFAKLAVASAEDMAAVQKETRAQADRLIDSDQRLISRSRAALATSRLLLQGRQRPTLDRDREFAHLRQADVHIAGARTQIERQRRLIVELRRGCLPTDVAESLLQTMHATLKAMQGHREIIRQQLGL